MNRAIKFFMRMIGRGDDVSQREKHWYVGTEDGALIDIDRDFISRHGEPWPRGEGGMLRSDKLTEAQWLAALSAARGRGNSWRAAFTDLDEALPDEYDEQVDRFAKAALENSHSAADAPHFAAAFKKEKGKDEAK